MTSRRRRRRPGTGRVGGAAAGPQPRAARRLRDRRQALHRAICAGRADRAAARSARIIGASAATGSARASSSTRSPAAISTPMSIIPARSGPTNMQRTDVKPRAEGAGRRGALAQGRRTASACSARSASRTPMRWPMPRALAREARHPFDRRSGGACRRACRSPAITNSSSGRNGRRSAPPMACTSASSAPCSPTSCIRPRTPAMSM